MSRIYRALLRCYPASFRAEHGDELCAMFERRAAHVSGPFRTLRIAADAFADVIPNATAAHVEMLQRDLTQVVRSVRRAPLFATGTIAVLALGIGANSAVFSVLQAVLLEPLPYENPSQLVMLWRSRPLPPDIKPGSADARVFGHIVLTPETVGAWRAATTAAFANFAVLRTWQGSLAAQFDISFADRTERLRGAIATPNFFTVLGVRAWSGRVFSDRDDGSTGPTVVISHGFWQRAFGGDASIIGRSLTLTGGSPRAPRAYTVIGVLPPGFRFTYPDEIEVWAREEWADVAQVRPQNLLAYYAVARRKPDVSLVAAQLRVGSLPKGPNGEIAVAEEMRDWVIGGARSPLLLIAGVALLLLATACITAANALLVRFTARRRELALRASLGANHQRLVRLLVTEGVVLAVAGAVAGTLVAIALGPALRAFAPASFPRADEIDVNARVLAFAALMAMTTIILAAVAPAVRGSRFDLAKSLRSSGASSDRAATSWRRGLVAAQSVAATTLLVGATLFATSLWKLGHAPLGFDGERVITVEMRLLGAPARDTQRVRALQDALLAKLRATPGIAEVGMTTAVPFRGADFMNPVVRTRGEKQQWPNMRYVDSGYFGVLRMGIVAGRPFTAADRDGAPKVAILSDSLARALFGTANPIGATIDPDDPKIVVGIVRDVRYRRLDVGPRPAMYLARAQYPDPLMCIVVRTATNARDVQTAIRRAIHDVDPTVPSMHMTTIDQIIASTESSRTFYTFATLAFAAVALALTLVGVAIIVSRSVLERTREMAIRAALGAPPTRLVALVAGQDTLPVVAGALVGIAVAFAAAGTLTPFLYQVGPRDPLSYTIVPAVIAVTGLLTALVPAWRVSGTNAAVALRSE